jgi:hypothetical protein
VNLGNAFLWYFLIKHFTGCFELSEGQMRQHKNNKRPARTAGRLRRKLNGKGAK